MVQLINNESYSTSVKKIRTRRIPKLGKLRNTTPKTLNFDLPKLSQTELKINGKVIVLSNLDKIFYPKTGFTKRQVIQYYIQISKVLLPHLVGRAVSLKRYPDGVSGEFFYEKRCPSHRPSWLRTSRIYSETRKEYLPYCSLADLPSLIWAANIANLEIHAFLSYAVKPQRPTVMVFDLDPGPGTDLKDCSEVALLIRNLFSQLGLKCYAKTSGSKGLQVYLPLNTAVSFDETKSFARSVAEALQKTHPHLIVAKMAKTLRRGKVLIDWSQNDDHKTTVCVYSLRATVEPHVSCPIDWEEVTMARYDPSKLQFSPNDVLQRVRNKGDLFSPVLQLKQKLPHLS